MWRRETLALVGESGCGKSTVARCLLRLVEPTAGSIRFGGEEVTAYRGARLRRYRRSVQIVFQDPFGSLSPRMRVGDLIAEPLLAHRLVSDGIQARQRVSELLELVGLSPEQAGRYPHEFSGGQRQRIAIARALAPSPAMLILDEPIAALDASIGAQILNLLADLQDELGVSYLFISHDLSVVRHLAHRVSVMYLGKIVETAGSTAIFEVPQHPYTQTLVSAIPLPDPHKERRRQRIRLTGEVPSPLCVPRGCRFHPRCFKAQPGCAQNEPPLEVVDHDHRAACFYAGPPTRPLTG